MVGIGELIGFSHDWPCAAVLRRVVVVGLGQVGLPVAVLAVAAGHTVVGYDTDPVHAGWLAAGGGHGDVGSEVVAAALATGRFTVTDDSAALDGFEVAVISVPTPLAAGRPDLRCVEHAAKTVAVHVRSGCTVILESTTWPGTTEQIVVPILESSGLKVGAGLRVGYAPERINPGDGLEGLAAVPKIVSGVGAESLAAVAEFWDSLVERVVQAPDTRTAELAKLIENTYRLINISMVNEIARYATGLGADIWTAIRLAATKPYGFAPFYPGIGAGGHCIPVAPRYLTWRIGDTGAGRADLIDSALAINDAAPVWVAERILAGLAVRGVAVDRAVVLAAGITYKPNVSDVRGSQAAIVIAHLRSCGVQVLVYDPLAQAAEVLRVVTSELVAEVSAVAVLVAHDRLATDMLAGAGYVFDACGVMSPAANVEFL